MNERRIDLVPRTPLEMDQDVIDELAALFWEEAGSHFNEETNEQKAFRKADEMAFAFLETEPALLQGKKVDHKTLAHEIASRVPKFLKPRATTER